MALSGLVEALNIFLKYGDPAYPTHCEHDELHVCVPPDLVSAEDRGRLEELGFLAGDGGFKSFRYGSA